MELRRNPLWSNKKGRRKFVRGILKPFRKRFNKSCKNDNERREANTTFNQAQGDLLRLACHETRWKPKGIEFNLSYLKKELQGLEGASEVLTWLEEGAPLPISHEEIETRVVKKPKPHSCFQNPEAVRNWAGQMLKEMEKGHLLGPFDDESTHWNGQRIIKHRSGMATKKGEPWKRIIRDFKVTGQNDLFEKEQTSIELIKTLEMIRM